jgi:hypothetical protein
LDILSQLFFIDEKWFHANNVVDGGYFPSLTGQQQDLVFATKETSSLLPQAFRMSGLASVAIAVVGRWVSCLES